MTVNKPETNLWMEIYSFSSEGVGSQVLEGLIHRCPCVDCLIAEITTG